MARPIKRAAVKAEDLHKGDTVYLQNQLLIVLGVHVESNSVLCSNRKQANSQSLKWIDARRLRWMPARFVNRRQLGILEIIERAGDGLSQWTPYKTPKPTDHLPGSPGKVDVLASRVVRGESLWHDGDAKFTME